MAYYKYFVKATMFYLGCKGEGSSMDEVEPWCKGLVRLFHWSAGVVGTEKFSKEMTGTRCILRSNCFNNRNL